MLRPWSVFRLLFNEGLLMSSWVDSVALVYRVPYKNSLLTNRMLAHKVSERYSTFPSV
jgi:hypothetical protein